MALTSVNWKSVKAERHFCVHYDMCVTESSEWIDLPPFAAADDDDLMWTLSFRPGKILSTTEDSFVAQKIKLQLRFTSTSGKKSVFAQRDIDVWQNVIKKDIDKVIADMAGEGVTLTKEDFKVECNMVYNHVPETSQVGKIVFHNSLTNQLNIHARITTSDKILDVENPPTLPRKRMKLEEDCAGETSLSSCLGSLLENPVFSDVTLVVDGREFPAHRNILAARSCVFKAMMSTSCKETLTGKVVIEDLRPPIVELMLRYMYKGSPWTARDEASRPASEGEDAEVTDWDASGDSDGDGGEDGDRDDNKGDADGDGSGDGDEDGTLLELMVAADKYMLPGLVALCQQRLAASLTDNPSEVKLCDVLRASHLLECAPLRRVGLEYLRCNRLKVLKSNAWKEFVSTNRIAASGALLDATTDASEDISN